MVIISVVRDFQMYDELVRNNPFNKDASLYVIDNRQENKNISTRYNEFLDSYDYNKPDWFVFCHEDWEVLQDWSVLDNLDKNCLWGPVGVLPYKKFPFTKNKQVKNIIVGQILESDKQGKLKKVTGNILITKNVSTFDCQCIIVHSSLIKKYNLRFDENLAFDLYAEDFCAAAMEKHKIPSKIVYLKCQHHSFGNVQDRYWKQLSYLQEKYKSSERAYCSTCSDGQIFGSHDVLYYIKNRLLILLYNSKVTSSGYRSIKVCKIPVWRKKVK